MTKFTNKFHAKQVYLPWLFAVPFLIFASASSFAQNGSCTVTGGSGGSNAYAPTGGEIISCASGGTAANSGITAPTNTTSQGNGISITLNSSMVYSLNYSTIGLGSSSTVSNSGSLDTGSFYNGYGISAGANGRSQAGGNTINNLGSITSAGGNAAGIYISATNTSSAANTISNAGTIQTTGANAAGIRLNSGTKVSGVLNSITNTATGVIATSGASANGIDVLGIGAVTVENANSITASGANSFGIYSAGNITTLTNSQGGSIPLTYSGILPVNYNVSVSSPTIYGKLDASRGVVSGIMNFGIKSGSTLAFNTAYTSVLAGIKVNNIGNSYGIFVSGVNTYEWALAHRINGSAIQTDLVVLPTVEPTVAALEAILATGSYLIAPDYYDTETALLVLGNTLQGLFALQSAGVINGMTYDCPLFGSHNICVSAGGRFTNVSTFPDNTTSALIIGAYRLSDSIRFGGYLDQNLSQSTPGGIAQLKNGSPMVGVFGVWSQNTDGTGLEVKIAAGYANKGVTLTRPVVGVSEAGSGSTSLNTQGVQGLLRYGFALGNKSVVSPYAGMRYVVGGMGAYSESQSSTVSTPLTYNGIDNYITTTLAGLMGSHKLNEKTTLTISAGVEKDVNASIGNLITSGVGDFNIAMNNNYRSTRPTASLGAFYDLSPRERLGLNGIYRQEAYQALTSTTVMATYTVGL